MDCLGRSRRCLKKDLNLYKRRDKELLRAIRRENGLDPNEEVDLENNEQVHYC